MRFGLTLSATILLSTAGVATARAGVCRDEINQGRMPPRSEADCAKWDAGMARQAEARDTKDTADMAVIEDYFRRNSTVLKPQACKPDTNGDGSPSSLMPGVVSQCRQEVETMDKIDSYFKRHPNALRPNGCELPLREGFLGECGVEVAAAEAPAPPKSEWHRLRVATIASYRQGFYSDGEYVTSQERETELEQGYPVLVHDPRGLSGNAVGGVVAVWIGFPAIIRAEAVDPKVIHCEAKKVLLHTDVSCDD